MQDAEDIRLKWLNKLQQSAAVSSPGYVVSVDNKEPDSANYTNANLCSVTSLINIQWGKVPRAQCLARFCIF